MSNMPSPTEFADLPIPSREDAYTHTLHLLAQALRSNEQVWLIGQQFDEAQTTWLIDILRRGAMGKWVRQRYRYDAQSGTLHFRGERTLGEAELNEARRDGEPFDIVSWKNR
ncbi:MAG: hypothetical protein Fur005_13600 [Roseiflexaceae bacterium]